MRLLPRKGVSMLAHPREKEPAPPAGRWRSGVAVLLATLVVGGTASISLRMYSESSEWSSASTTIGNYRRLPLSDGSTLELNTNTEIRYRLSEQVRLLDLTAGEARFRVAHDTRRPFVVLARDTVIRAVGTEFTVRIRENGKVDVMVADGVVAVSHRRRKSAVSELLHGPIVSLEGGTAVPEKKMVTDDGGRFAFVEMSRARMEAHDAWRNNMLVFDGTPLAEVAAEFNRYNRRKLLIADPSIEGVLIGGRYRPRDVEGFLLKLSEVMKVRVVEKPAANALDGSLEIHAAIPTRHDHK
jgi:transmembrane sensor